MLKVKKMVRNFDQSHTEHEYFTGSDTQIFDYFPSNFVLMGGEKFLIIIGIGWKWMNHKIVLFTGLSFF